MHAITEVLLVHWQKTSDRLTHDMALEFKMAVKYCVSIEKKNKEFNIAYKF